jgi:bifunctional non-homologous end joining protein LigD
MSLSLYKEKRKFEETPEPEGTEKSSQGRLRFVIQKHDASHLHYDFRLEMQGVLKSWAVPKGPSLNPSDKRLAMMVEDHPYDYRTFEGIIPAGNYGGGTVMVWDEGTFQPEGGEDLSLKEQEKLLLSKFHSGDLKIVLHGKKVKGSYALVKLKRDEKSWLLIKHKDKYAGEEDITQKNKSVVSKKTLAQIAKENGTELNHPEDPTSGVKKGAGAAKKATTKNPTLIKESKKEQTNDSIKKAPAKTKKIKTSGIILEWDEEKDQEIIIEKNKLSVTSLDKIYWKKEKLTKGDSINYYLKIAPYILPYMLDRPQSLNRHPNGIDAPNFFQKDMKGNIPEWLETHKDFSESTNQDVHYMICANEASLIYMSNLGCIEMNPWHSRSLTWQKPDWCLIDLDPDTTNTFEQVIETAQVVKKVLDSIGAESCVKTSGSSGIHIYIPLGAQYDYEQSKQLAQLVVTLVQAELPELTSLERSPAKRKGKIYLDFLQNRETQTAAAPYSLRPKREAPVSTPLHWDEVKKGLTSTTYTMKNIFERLKAEGDLFQPVLGKGINIEKVLKNLDSIAS